MSNGISMERVEEIIDRYDGQVHHLIAIMQDIQSEYKYLSPAVLERIAEKLGVGRTAYVYYETGKALPALPTVRLLMELYQVSADAFLYPERYLAENRQAAEAGEA